MKMKICNRFNDPNCPDKDCKHNQPHQHNFECEQTGPCSTATENGRSEVYCSQCIPVPNKQFVCLQGVMTENLGNRFFCINHTEQDPTKGYTGETWYRVIGYADTVAEAQEICGLRLLAKTT